MGWRFSQTQTAANMMRSAFMTGRIDFESAEIICRTDLILPKSLHTTIAWFLNDVLNDVHHDIE